MREQVLTIYFAGDLFDAKDLGGNLMLAAAVEKVSGGRYQVQLPQNGECEVKQRTSQSIRDADFELLFRSDVMVANFDGHDLDSGTVVEYCFAKMLDMPAVLLRTDFRNSGDHTLPDGDPWNLMCSHYPGTKVLHINGMMRYHRSLSAGTAPETLLQNYYDSLAEDLVRELDCVVKRRSWMRQEEVLQQYRMAIRSIGGTLSERLPEETLEKLVNGKIQKGIY